MSFIIFISIFIVALIVPGIILWYRIRGHDSSVDIYALLPEWFIYSFSIGIIPGLYILFYHKTLSLFLLLYSLLVIVLVVLSWKHIRQGLSLCKKELLLKSVTMGRGEAIIFVVAIVIMVISTFLFRFGPSSDSWVTCANVRHYLSAPEIYTRNPIFIDSDYVTPRSYYDVLGLFYALFSFCVRGDVFTLVFTYVKIPLIILACLSLYALSMEVIRKRIVAVFSILVLSLFCLMSIYTQEGVGYFLFDRINQDKTVMAFIFIPMILKFMYRFLQQGQKVDLCSFGISAAGAVVLHPQGIIFTGVALLSYMLFTLLLGKRMPVLKRFFVVLIPVVIVAVLPFYQRVKVQALPQDVSKFSYSIQELKDLYLLKLTDEAQPCALQPGGETLPRGRFISLVGKGFYIAHPNVINHSFYIATILIALYWLLNRMKRRTNEYIFLTALTLMPPLVVFNPITAPLVGYVTTAFKMWRFIWLIPVPLVMANFIYEAAAKLKVRMPLMGSTMLILLLIVAISSGYERGMHGKKFYDAINKALFVNSAAIGTGAYNQRWFDITDVVMHIHEGGRTRWLLAPRHINTRIPAYYDDIGILAFRGYTQTYYWLVSNYSIDVIEERVATTKLYSAGALTTRAFKKALRKFDIDTIVIDKEFAAKYYKPALALGFKKTYENASYYIVKKQ